MKTIPSIVKVGLNAQKARQLAKSVGIIPHEKSQWQWALRQLRKANPKGIKNAPLVMQGKELSKAKERIGKLPNNQLQKLKALQRKQRLGIETAITNKGNYIVGDVGVVRDSKRISEIITSHNKSLVDLK